MQAENNSKLTLLKTENINQNLPIETDNKKTYFFESQTKRLKHYYGEHPQKLLMKKILFNNSVGIVKYIGGLRHQGRPANSDKQLWVGVEWDEENRGKHNGQVNGYKYFQSPQKKGSLLKFQKIQFGYKLQTALFKRYFRVQELHHAKNIYQSLKSFKEELKDHTEKQRQAKCQEMLKKKIHKIEYDSQAYVDTLKKNKKIMIQFIGFDEIWAKINNLDKLYSISLAQCKICDFGPSGHLKSLLPNLKILSLENNLLSSWDQVYQLGLELKWLSELSIAYNILSQPNQQFEDIKSIQIVSHDETIIKEEKIFPNLKCIILINTGLTWKIFFKVIPAITGIQQLILCKNNLSDVYNINLNKLQHLNHLKFLNLQQTNQTSFQGINKFASLPKLQKLTLNKNYIQCIGKLEKGFETLKHLSIQSNAIHHPVTISEISNFQNLESINIKHNPMSEKMGNAYVRMRAVAQLCKLKCINGAMLKKYQRKDCQIYYMKESFRQYFALRKVPDYDYDYDDFLNYCKQWHPNVPRLIKIFGNPYEVSEKKQIKQIIKEEVKIIELKKGTGMIELFLHIIQTSQVETKKIPLSWTLSSLKNFIAKTIKIPVGSQQLKVKVEEESVEEEMNEDHKPLSYYNLKTYSRIYIHRLH